MVGRVLESVVWVALGMDFHLFFVVFFFLVTISFFNSGSAGFPGSE